MKKVLFLIAFVFVLSACNGGFSKGVKKDLVTGLSASYNGFGIQDIYLASGDGNRLATNKISLGSKIKIVATGVANYTEKNGRVFPGCMIVLTDTKGNTLLNLPDAFSDIKEGVAQQEATVLQADLSTGNPMKTGEQYHMKARFFDKQNPQNEIVADVDVVMN